MFQKITDNLFYLFIFLLPWQMVFILREPMIGGEKWQYGTIGIYLTDIILVAWLLTVFLCKTKNFHAYRQIGKPKSLKNRKFDKNLCLRLLLTAYCLLLAWSFFSIFWSADSLLAFYFFLKLLLGAGLFLALQKVKINWRKIIFVFLAAAVLQSVLGIGQFLTQGNFSSKWLGMNNYETWRGGVSVLENEEGRWLRAYGSLPHPNILGGYLAVVFLLGVIIVNQKSKCKNQNYKSKLKILKSWKLEIKNLELNHVIYISALLIILLGILLTFSRGAWLALAVGIIFLGANIWSRTIRPAERDELSARKNFAKLLLVFGLAGLIFVSINHENFSARFDAGKRLEQRSISERSLYFNQAKQIIGENFWLGAGAGNYTLAVFQKDETKKPIWQYQPAHNVFMLIWAELGIVGLVLFLAVLISLLIKSNSQFRFLLIAFYLLLFFDHWLWTTHFGILFFWLVAGLAVRKN